jgi:hypothetical protein
LKKEVVLAQADGMISIIAHEIAEVITDPDANAWFGHSLLFVFFS